MQPTSELINAIYIEKVRRARTAAPSEKLFAGIELFEMACEWTKAGIRDQHPQASEAEVVEILRKRLAWRRRAENDR